MGQLDGKSALVTGGSRGIGAAIAQRLAEEGANVAITYATSPDEATKVAARIEEQGTKSLTIQADSSDADALTAAVHEAGSTLGAIDILVNNAGIWRSAPIDELDVETIDRMLAIHVRAIFVATKAALSHMSDGGRIISIGSNLAERVPFTGLSLYSASKSALHGLTRGLARDLGPRGITATVVQPGSTDTDMNPAAGAYADAQRAHNALGRYAEATDITATVAHVAGEGGKFISGSTITIDGGFNS